MCPNRDLFSTYGSVEGEVVCMTNGSPSKVIGIDIVQIKMHNMIIRTLSDVRHVFSLKKNPISLGILDSKGCRINIESSDIKVSHKALVLMKGKKIENLYALEGSMMTDETLRPGFEKIEHYIRGNQT
ncbi:hypothetical protein J1N35_010979 [Gossypium stocksii]|uniref:Retrovirus-related Pol polyprotein from transposon TNT 1-94-like beta-barrel domain-containing protein n=1 Tax=Gossypium stocksii TaxID=47602 RepID=A0A9D3W136_9ROSI|nr:hypothetical protein J1N35_010979 [Gossypium stocksii]